MRVLLIQPPVEDFYLTSIRTYPLNLIYLSTALQKAGIEVSILDTLNPPTRKTKPYPRAFDYLKDFYSPYELGPAKLFGHYYRFGMSDREILDHIAKTAPDVIGISANFTAYFDTVTALCKTIKATFPHIKIVLGGYHATVFGAEIIEQLSEVDHVIVGEGEAALLDYLGAPSDSFKFESFTPNHRFIEPAHYQMHRQNMAAIIASRGCAKACTFCTVSSMFGRAMRWRNIESVIVEMQTLYEKNNVRVFDFEDDNLSINKKWFTTLLERICETLPDVRLYAMNGIAMETLDAPMLTLMWKAGFRNLNISLVTAQESEQSRLNRPKSNAIFERVVQDAKAIGFEITVYFILGLPGQTAADVEETLSFLYGYDVLVAPSVFYPPPGTALYKNEPWLSCRSSAFSTESAAFTREEQVAVFRRVRLLNFMQLTGKRFGVETWTLAALEKIDPKSVSNEDKIGLVQIREYLQTGEFERVYRTSDQS